MTTNLTIVDTLASGTSVLALSSRASLAEMAAAVLDVPPDTPLEVLATALIDEGNVVTPDWIKKTIATNEQCLLHSAGFFCFVVTVTIGGLTVSGAHWYRSGREWVGSASPLGFNLRWNDDVRLLIPNYVPALPIPRHILDTEWREGSFQIPPNRGIRRELLWGLMRYARSREWEKHVDHPARRVLRARVEALARYESCIA